MTTIDHPDFKELQKSVEEFRTEFNKERYNLQKCNTLLSKLKLLLVKFQLFPPFTAPKETVKQHLLLARETYELAALLSIRAGDDDGAFERTVSQLKTYYRDYASLLPESERKWPIIGLSLMHLLANNRIAEFHTELELIPIHEWNPHPTLSGRGSFSMSNNISASPNPKPVGKPILVQPLPAHSAPTQPSSFSNHPNIYITFPVSLEQRLMEGSYNKILTAKNAVPLAEYNFFLSKLVDTVRNKISDCNEKAYESLPLDDARNLLMFKTNNDLLSFAKTRAWTIKDSTVLFNKPKDPNQNAIPTHVLIKQLLTYATELERII